MKKYFIIILILLALTISAFFIDHNKTNTRVTIKNKTFRVELAQTGSQREQGLMNRDHLDINSGMLFVFPNSDIHSFWMKDTKIPLDIIWIDEEKVTEIMTLDPQIGADIPSYTPKNKANYVLEINAGIAKDINIKVGDSVKIKY